MTNFKTLDKIMEIYEFGLDDILVNQNNQLIWRDNLGNIHISAYDGKAFLYETAIYYNELLMIVNQFPNFKF